MSALPTVGAKQEIPGTFYLRIEDTDDKRFVEGAVETIINSLKFFGITFDEGAALRHRVRSTELPKAEATVLTSSQRESHISDLCQEACE